MTVMRSIEVWRGGSGWRVRQLLRGSCALGGEIDSALEGQRVDAFGF